MRTRCCAEGTPILVFSRRNCDGLRKVARIREAALHGQKGNIMLCRRFEAFAFLIVVSVLTLLAGVGLGLGLGTVLSVL
jgi:hypothetical protein